MKYALLIYSDETIWEEMTEGRTRRGAGPLHGSHRGPEAARSVRPGRAPRRHPDRIDREGTRGADALTDGPFAETKEQLGGFYVVDVPDLDAALAIAGRIRRPAWARSRCGRFPRTAASDDVSADPGPSLASAHLDAVFRAERGRIWRR